jgi:hypothetical protein
MNPCRYAVMHNYSTIVDWLVSKGYRKFWLSLKYGFAEKFLLSKLGGMSLHCYIEVLLDQCCKFDNVNMFAHLLERIDAVSGSAFVRMERVAQLNRPA